MRPVVSWLAKLAGLLAGLLACLLPFFLPFFFDNRTLSSNAMLHSAPVYKAGTRKAVQTEE